MQHLSLTKYARYIKEKANIDLIEWEHSFMTYEIIGDICMIRDTWVDPDHRGNKISQSMADEIVRIAKTHNCKKLVSTLAINTNSSTEALLNQISYGMKLASADSEKLYLIKEI